MKTFDDEIELKKALDSVGVRYGDTYNEHYFLIEYRDNKGGTVIAKNLFYSPIAAVREIGVIIKQTNIPADDIDVVLTYTIPINKHTMLPNYCDFKLSPYLYYKKPETVNIGGNTNENSTSADILFNIFND